MKDHLTPARIVPPGRILIQELEARNLTQKDLAEIMDRPVQTINAIINAKKEITPETALEIAAALDISPEFWMNLEINYRLHLAQKKHYNDGSISKRKRLYELAPIAELVKRKWIPKTETLDELENAVCEFLDISSPLEKPRFAVNCRQKEFSSPENPALIAWGKRVEYLVKDQTVGVFDRERVEAAIPDILRYARKEEDIEKIPPLLNSLGIYFIIVPHLPKTYLDGATFFINDHPVIALTLRYNRIDSFWFTLLHELGHIVSNHRGVYLDDINNLEKTPQEEEADSRARDYLLDRQELEKFLSERRGKFSAEAIERFAESQARHPGIIVGRLQHNKEMNYKTHRKYLVKVDRFLQEWSDRS
jgi:HTH-type transcriptional regulator / antitoxin HigA